MARELSIERGVLTFKETLPGGNTMIRVPISDQSVESCHTTREKGTERILQIEIVMPVRGRLVLGTRHGDSAETLEKLVRVCRAKGIATHVSHEPPRQQTIGATVPLPAV